MNISANLKYLRNKNLFTQEDLADKLGIAKAKYGTYERGIHEPNIETIIKISQLYSISIDDLILKDLTNGDGIGLIKDIQNPSLAKEDSIAHELQKSFLDGYYSLTDEQRKSILAKESSLPHELQKSFLAKQDKIADEQRKSILAKESSLSDELQKSLWTGKPNDQDNEDLELIIEIIIKCFELFNRGKKKYTARLEGDAK